MATSILDLSQMAQIDAAFWPQTFSSTGRGLTVSVANVNAALMNAVLQVGAVNTLTSLDVKIQASVDGSTWVDCTDEDGNTVAFTQVTVLNKAQIISFQLPTALTATAKPFIDVAMYATLVGTSVLLSGFFISQLRIGPGAGSANSPGSPIN